jgi:hypothetical protein
MLHKHFKRARRYWRTIAVDATARTNPSCDPALVDWAREFGEPLIEEVQRLRNELKRSNKKRRGVYASLHVEEDEFDRMIGKIKDVLGSLPADPAESVSSYTITEQLGAILSEFEDED